ALRELGEARGIENVLVHRAGMVGEIKESMPARFDRILIDAPCSNSGVMARRAEARYHQSREAIESLEQLQRRIVADTLAALSEQGLLVYSTCSIWPEENERMIEWLL